MSDKQLRFKVTSTEGDKEYFATRKEAKNYVKQQKETKTFAEFRIMKINKWKNIKLKPEKMFIATGLLIL